jgi:hypothetical protein
MLGSTFKFDLHKIEIPETWKFEYSHPLAIPIISPGWEGWKPPRPLSVEGKAILRFGIIEGDAIVKGDRVVYDPQSAKMPKYFSENGSQAKDLAIVANFSEAFKLTGMNNVRSMSREIMKRDGASCVVIKMGTRGAYVTNGIKGTIVSPQITSQVWSIGSGDIFSAIFTSEWAIKRKGPVQAAVEASKAVGEYAISRSLPIPPRLKKNKSSPARLATFRDIRENFSRPLIYLAAPFFTMAQRWMVEQVRKALLDAGLSVFSPYHQVGHGLAHEVVPADINALERAKAVFAIADGMDSGTLFEIGFARAKGIPVIVFVENESQGDLKMLEGTECKITSDLTTAVYSVAWKVT